MDIFFEQSAMGKEHEVEFDLDSRIVCLDVSICTCCIYFGSNWREVRQAVFERDGKPYLTKSSVLSKKRTKYQYIDLGRLSL